jgi:hypothetical protein
MEMKNTYLHNTTNVKQLNNMDPLQTFQIIVQPYTIARYHHTLLLTTIYNINLRHLSWQIARKIQNLMSKSNPQSQCACTTKATVEPHPLHPTLDIYDKIQLTYICYMFLFTLHTLTIQTHIHR